jgi:TolA-binding protein
MAWLGAWLLILMSCNSEGEGMPGKTCEERKSQIDVLATETFERMEPAPESLQQLARTYADFANSCHDHPAVPEMLFRRADILLGLGKPQEAIAQYRDIHDHFATFEKRPECAFLMGFIYDAHLGDRSQATKVYREVVNLYPQTDAADWARQALVVLGEQVEEELAPIQIEWGL